MFTKKSELFFILGSFVIWRIVIFLITYLSVKYVPLFSENYLGGGYTNYISNPIFWGHINFDGEHYLSIIQNGYQPLQYFFFPLFPLLVKSFAFIKTQENIAIIGIVISNISFLFALMGVYKLVRVDFKESIVKLTVILFLVFPTSFYFGIYYTESLFLALIVWSFYFARKNNFLLASIIAAFASATRVIGGVMFPVLIIEMLIQKRKDFLPIFIAPLGVVSYMYYLLKQTGDPLIFLHQVNIFGEQRSSTFVLLPQVFFRYIFKILPSVNYSYFPNVFTTYLEFGVSIFIILLILIGLFKIRLNYSIYAIFAFLIPSLAGSFSSMPRYVLAIFPVFILGALILDKSSRIYKYLVMVIFIILLTISTAMFWRGYWLS